MTDLYDRFTNLFQGLDRAFGKYILDDNIIASDGQKAKGRGVTMTDDLLPEHYTQHLNGEQMLGVVPIQDGNLCSFAAIDIDDYSLKIPDVLKQIKSMNLPLVPTRSKSGGLHLWMFFVDPIPARAAMQKLEQIADALGFPGVEVFPKQYQIGPEDVGNWINLPWYDHRETDRYGWDLDGNELRDLGDWLDYAEERRITLKELNRVSVADAATNTERPFADGPPCLQTLAERGIGEGMRNNVMFSIGVYAHNKFQENVEQATFMHEANKQYFDPRMSDKEVETIRNQIDTNDGYRYPCTQAPIKDVCNRGMCLRRPYGVRLNGQTFSFGGLWQFVPVTDDDEELHDECSWRLQINHNDNQYMIDVSTVTDLRTFRTIDTKAANRRFILPAMDQNEWRDLINDKIENCEVVVVSEEMSSIGTLRILISQFLNLYGAGTESKQEVLLGKVWHDAAEEVYWFKGDKFLSYLKTQRYTDYEGTALFKILKDRFGIEITRKWIGKKNPRIWLAPERLRIMKDDIPKQGFKEVF